MTKMEKPFSCGRTLFHPKASIRNLALSPEQRLFPPITSIASYGTYYWLCQCAKWGNHRFRKGVLSKYQHGWELVGCEVYGLEPIENRGSIWRNDTGNFPL